MSRLFLTMIGGTAVSRWRNRERERSGAQRWLLEPCLYCGYARYSNVRGVRRRAAAYSWNTVHRGCVCDEVLREQILAVWKTEEEEEGGSLFPEII
jgi:hypothetical protein